MIGWLEQFHVLLWRDRSSSVFSEKVAQTYDLLVNVDGVFLQKQLGIYFMSVEEEGARNNFSI